jgi:hypothetical protein
MQSDLSPCLVAEKEVMELTDVPDYHVRPASTHRFSQTDK